MINNRENKTNKRGRWVKRQRKLWKEMHSHKGGYLKYRTMTGRERKLADMMDQRNVKQGTLKVAANYSTMELMDEKMG